MGPAPAVELPFDDRTNVREILRRWPATREVFDQAGLLGCGGEQGPDEPLGFFARMHHVPLEPLKLALYQVVRAGGAHPARRELPVAPKAPLVAEPVHRYVPFLLGSVALALTLGAALGTFNLARLTTPWFGGLPSASVRAHAFAQVFGFIGLFIMGVACHVLPRFASRPLALSSLVRPMLGLQTGGVLAIGFAFLARGEPIRWLWAGGSAVLFAAGAIFTAVVAQTVAGADTRERFARWVIAGAAWLVLASLGSLAAAWRGDPAIIQTLWPAALWGFAVSWIFGIGRRIFPGFLGWKPRYPRAETVAFLTYQVSVGFLTAADWPRVAEPSAWLLVPGAFGLIVSVSLFVACLGITSAPLTRHDVERGYQRFVTAGFVWLGVVLLAGPSFTLAAALSGSVVPRLVTDFSRHALALGFVTQIIMGVATRILPVFTGNALWSPRARSAAFYLLNAAVVLRGLEAIVALGFVPAAWPYIAFAGPPAFAAFVLFAANVVFTIYGRPAAASRPTGSLPLADRAISDILRIPGALDVLVAAGFTPLRNPLMRTTLAGSVTLRQACSLKGVPLAQVIARLEALQSEGGG